MSWTTEAVEASRELALSLGQGVRREGRTLVVKSRTRGGLDHRVTPTLDGDYICTCEAQHFGNDCWVVKWFREEKIGMTEQTMALQPVQVLPPQALLPSDRDYMAIDKAAKLAFSGAVALPKELNTPQKVGAVMLYGWELGLRPMTALQELYIVNGRVQPSARIMAGLLQARTDATIKIVEATDKVCTLRLIWPSRHIDEQYTVTWDEIVRAKLSTRDVWASYPRDKLITHCTKRILRVYAPDVINGITGPILTDTETPDDEPDESELWNPGERVIDHETGEIIEAEVVDDTITDATKKAVREAYVAVQRARGDDFVPEVQSELARLWPHVFPAEPGAGHVNKLSELTEAQGLDVLAFLNEEMPFTSEPDAVQSGLGV